LRRPGVNELPLSADPRWRCRPPASADLQQAMASASYPMVNVQAISLSGPRDAASAMKAIQESFCQVVLDPQFVDVGVSHQTATGASCWHVRCCRQNWRTGRVKARNCLNNSTPPAPSHVNAAARPSPPLRRWPGMPAWHDRPGSQPRHGQQQLLRPQGP
jgi:hypothetical protein